MKPLRLRVGALAVVQALSWASPASGQDNPHGKEGAREAPSAEAAPGEGGGESHGDTVTRVGSEVSAYADTDAVSVFTPAVRGSIENPVSGWSANGSYLVDVVSAASVDIVSTASSHWTEVRHAAALGGQFKPNTFGASVSGSVSREPDYLSLSGGGSLLFELADKTVNPTVGYTFTQDTAGRKDTPFSVFSQPLARHTGSAGIELILDPLTLIHLSADAIFEIGDQKKPYRFLPIFHPEEVRNIPRGASVEMVNALRLPGRVSEHTPDKRNRLALSARLAQRLSGSTFILTERVYLDDWGLKASTTDLRFVIDVSRRVFVWTHLRGHFQGGVSFWKRAYGGQFDPATGRLAIPELRTGDRELGPLAAGTFGAGSRFNIGSSLHPTAWSLVAQADTFSTRYADALFIQARQGYLGVLQLEAEF